MKDLNRTIGLFSLRGILALIFLMQGYGKVFQIGVNNIAQHFFLESYQDTFLPEWFLIATAYYTSYVELIAGFLLLIGLFRNYCLYALASVLLIVTFGHGLREPIWDMHHVLFRAILLIPLLLLPEAWDRWRLDYFLKKKR